MVDITYVGPPVLLGSVSTPATTYQFEHETDGIIEFSYTYETGKHVEFYFRQDAGWSSPLVDIETASNNVYLKYHDGEWHNVAQSDGVFTNGVSAKVTVAFVGTNVKVYIDDVLKINETVDINVDGTVANLIHDLASNDIELSWYTAGGVPELEIVPYNFLVKKTYYMRADGTAATKEDATSDAAAATSMSLATHNSETGLGGCNLVISSAGGVYRGTLSPKSGDAGCDTMYIGSGSPAISGAALISGWTLHAGDVWKATVTTGPYQVWADGTFGDRKTSLVGVVNNYDWFWDDPTNTLYLYSAAGDPDSYVSPGIEVSSLINACTMQDVSYVSFSGLTFERAYYAGVYSIGCSNLTFSECTFQWNWMDGCIFGTTETNPTVSSVVIEDCVARYNGGQGISFAATHTSFQDCVVRRNQCYENGRYQCADPVWEYNHNFTGGIKFFTVGIDSGLTCLRCIVEQNRIYNNGPTSGATSTGQGAGVWFDYASGTSGNENIIRHNVIYDNSGVPLYNEVCNYNHWHGNLCYGNAQDLEAGDWSVCNIRCDARDGHDSSYNKFYNNTCYGGIYGILCLTTDQTAGTELNGNEFKNNILAGITNEVLYADTGGDNDGANGTGNVYSGNCFGAQATNFIWWDGANYSTYDAWAAVTDRTENPDNHIEADPQFFNAGSDQYWLASGSPCLGAGADLGDTYKWGLHPNSVWPDAVNTVDQDLQVGWNMGAYGDGAQHALAGTIAAISTLTGDMGADRALAGTIAAQSTLTGDMGADRALAGTIAAISTLAGDMGADKALAGTIAAISTLAGDMSVDRILAGIIAAQSTLTGDMTVVSGSGDSARNSRWLLLLSRHRGWR